jgi:hypothetical protein
MMRLNMITVDRSPHANYLGSTLSSLARSVWNAQEIPLTLCVGNEKEAYAAGLGYDVLSWNGPQFENRWVSFVDNYVRALRHGDGDVIVCEDDLEFAPGWVERLKAGVCELRAYRSRFVLSMYAPWHPGWTWRRSGKHHRPYRTSRFFGTQAMFYPADVRLELADYMEEHRRQKPGDLLISQWCDAHNESTLFLLRGSVVQHVGSVSTGLGSGRHRAWNLLS